MLFNKIKSNTTTAMTLGLSMVLCGLLLPQNASAQSFGVQAENTETVTASAPASDASEYMLDPASDGLSVPAGGAVLLASFAVGVVGYFPGLFMGALAGYIACKKTEARCDNAVGIGALGLGFAGMVTGNVFGAHAMGYLLGYRSPASTTIVATIIAGAVGFGVGLALHFEFGALDAHIALPMITAPFGAVIGYALTARRKSSESGAAMASNSLLSYSPKAGLALGVPAIAPIRSQHGHGVWGSVFGGSF